MERVLEIPYERLSKDALRGLIEEFVTREGTDYGHGVKSLDEKAASVERQLKLKEAVVVFDPETGTANIVLKKDLKG